MDSVRVREYCCSVVAVRLEKQLEAGRPSEDQNTWKDTVSRGEFTSAKFPVIVKTFNMGSISHFGHGWWLPMCQQPHSFMSSRIIRSGAPE